LSADRRLDAQHVAGDSSPLLSAMPQSTRSTRLQPNVFRLKSGSSLQLRAHGAVTDHH
jgi:hypothetical protein